MALDINDYQDSAEETAIYPSELPDHVDVEAIYTALGLAGETGEVAEDVKKAIRDDDPEKLDDLYDELGDVIWYWSQLCRELGFDAADVLDNNLGKLHDRQERDVLQGDGDNR